MEYKVKIIGPESNRLLGKELISKQIEEAIEKTKRPFELYFTDGPSGYTCFIIYYE